MKGIGASTIMSILGIIVLILVVAILISCIKIVHGINNDLVCRRIGVGFSAVPGGTRNWLADWRISGCFHRPVCVYQALGDEICQ